MSGSAVAAAGSAAASVAAHRGRAKRNIVASHFVSPSFGARASPRGGGATAAVEGGDIVVVASDGCFDNMRASLLKETIERYLATAEWDSTKVAEIIAEKAYLLSLDETILSPFAEEARKLGDEPGRHFEGKRGFRSQL